MSCTNTAKASPHAPRNTPAGANGFLSLSSIILTRYSSTPPNPMKPSKTPPNKVPNKHRNYLSSTIHQSINSSTLRGQFPNIAIVLKTGSETLIDRVAIQLATFLNRIENLLVVGDKPGFAIGDYKMVDVYSQLYVETRKRMGLKLDGSQDDLAGVKRMWSNNAHKNEVDRRDDELAFQRRDRVVSVQDIQADGKADAHKNLPAFILLLEKYPDADWFLIINDDSYVYWDNLAEYLKDKDPSKPYYTGQNNHFKVAEEIDALKKERTEAKKALERAIKDKDPADIRGNLQSLFDGAIAELKRLGEKEVELMRQKDRRTAVIEAKQGSRSSSDSSLSIKDSSPQSIASDSMDVDVRWKDEVPPVYSLNAAKLFFVNRSAAVEQLQKIHGFKFHRATSKVGKEWIIPIADNVIGLGKSDFGRHYIRKSRESWPTATEIGSFEKTLCDCHTVHIEFLEGALLKTSFDAVMIELLCEALKDMFVVQPAILSKPPKTVNAFLDNLTKVAGPVFIVLDEIGKAFRSEDDSLDDFAQRDQFYSFCRRILDKWLRLKNVFFVVLGRASFLNYVALRPTNAPITPSPYVFERLNIHLLRPPSIRTIMDRTLISSTGTDTIADRLELTQQTSEAVAEHLFRQTNGHPRSLLDAFESCHSVDELLQYHKPLEMNWKEFYEKLVLNEATVTRLLNYVESGDTIDLTETTDDAGKKSVTLDNIASNSFIAWEGTVLKAKLYVHPTVKMYMEDYFMPFREYLKRIGNMTRVTIYFPTVFEWMFLKRFQEIFFQAPNEPRLALPAFFGTPKFGNYTSVSFSKSVRPIPKITSAGSASASLDSDTARPAAWPRLLDSIGPGPICLKPLSKSASSDAFLIGSAKFGAESFVLTVGLAVKNYGTTAFSWSHLSNECFVFNRMFEGAASFLDIRKSLQRQNILILCEFGMEDGSDAFMLDYIVESLRQSSARYIIVTGSNDFTAAFILGMGSREMVEKNHVYIGTNYPMPSENATLLYGSRYFELIRGFVLVSCANSDTSRPTFQEGRQELIRLSGYNFTDNDVIYNALDSFYDCAMNMVSGWNLLLPDSSILDLSTKKLNHLMNYSLFKNTGYHGMITDPFILTEQGDLQK
ncbi:hypothetical protein BJ741DRAFT_714474 [Chytriomyces cf. hyalinus JEL632]|nr:hypothetical protein BJ741DRAFT_714474 [Chytriomyces cf. hyalinus JEL632]